MDTTGRIWFIGILSAAIVLLNAVIVSTIPASSEPITVKWLFGAIQFLELTIIAMLAFYAGRHVDD
jgi:hypothetical protein